MSWKRSKDKEKTVSVVSPSQTRLAMSLGALVGRPLPPCDGRANVVVPPQPGGVAMNVSCGEAIFLFEGLAPQQALTTTGEM